MPLHPTWTDIALRLLLTLIAGVCVGLDCSVRGQTAGSRTTILVGTAACLAMIQTNLLLSLDGKTSSSCAVMDLMRLPLGILIGVRLHRGGAILKRGDMVTGVTTAATTLDDHGHRSLFRRRPARSGRPGRGGGGDHCARPEKPGP